MILGMNVLVNKYRKIVLANKISPTFSERKKWKLAEIIGPRYIKIYNLGIEPKYLYEIKETRLTKLLYGTKNE